jgi:hypothetical protein
MPKTNNGDVQRAKSSAEIIPEDQEYFFYTSLASLGHTISGLEEVT